MKVDWHQCVWLFDKEHTTKLWIILRFYCEVDRWRIQQLTKSYLAQISCKTLIKMTQQDCRFLTVSVHNDKHKDIQQNNKEQKSQNLLRVSILNNHLLYVYTVSEYV